MKFIIIHLKYHYNSENDNIDNIISYQQLPYITVTSIIPFKGVLVYDGMLSGIAVKTGNSFEDIIEKEYNNMIKYYHL